MPATAFPITAAGSNRRKAMMASPSSKAAAAMERHGVTPPIAAYVEK
jgi:hypothetical protein